MSERDAPSVEEQFEEQFEERLDGSEPPESLTDLIDVLQRQSFQRRFEPRTSKRSAPRTTRDVQS